MARAKTKTRRAVKSGDAPVARVSTGSRGGAPVATGSPGGAPEPRKRRTSEEARAEILDAAERRLVVSGPSGIRLQEVAADVGISHPAVLHHFGSREGLVTEVCERRFAAIHEDLVRAIASSAGGADDVGRMFESVFRALEGHGHGRVVFWLALEGVLRKRDELRLRDVSLATHALRLKKHKEKTSGKAAETPSLEDTSHVVVLAAFALLAESVVGKTMLRDAGLGDDRAAGLRFRTWLAALLADHLDR